ncbi:FecR domain-containing protein [Bordetella hinzii]|uniref:FecR family protein n=1 Tax=Bordetella hinzii TaxID=103855 RepID=UPI002A18DA32|nr:FecR domain-containing protein [Bordetella hinzii]WPL79273.1 FecR domain-containing protein [Bordetella hinzii]
MTSVPKPPRDPLDAAAYWFARDHGGLMTADERRQFEAWRRADAAHERAYQEMLQVWDLAQAVPDRELRALLAQPAPARARPPGRRRFAWSLAATACALAGAGLTWPLWRPSQPLFQQGYATARGERRRLALPDDSVLTLNTATQAEVRYTRDERRVALRAGEMLFDVTPDPARPFIVETELGRVRVTGTRFNVRYERQRLEVAVESGSVEVATGAWWRRERVRLAAGQGTTLGRAGQALRAEAVDVAALTAWRQGKAVFDNVPLAQVVDEINRYREQPIRVAAALRGIRIAGVFDVDDTRGFLAALPALIPVRVVPRADGGSELVAR